VVTNGTGLELAGPFLLWCRSRTIKSFRNATPWVGDLAQWYSACLASTRPWVQSPAPKKRKKKEMQHPQNKDTKTPVKLDFQVIRGKLLICIEILWSTSKERSTGR